MEEFEMPGLCREGRWHTDPTINASTGIDRVAVEEPPKDWKPRPLLGFTVSVTETEPLLWEGDCG